MNAAQLDFVRPDNLQATLPPEERGLSRDGVRLLVSSASGHYHARFADLPDLLSAGDVLVVNDSATLPASLPAEGSIGRFTVNLSTRYADDLWLVEPRLSHGEPGPLPIHAGERAAIAGLEATFVSPYPGLERLWFTRFEGDLAAAIDKWGAPIRYGYVSAPQPLAAYQTIFARHPGSAEMPSAARPFTTELLKRLREKGVIVAAITLHTGVSSIEVAAEDIALQPFYPEPFAVPEKTARLLNGAKKAGQRVIAVGTTVVRALESAWDGRRVLAAAGFTRHVVRPGKAVNVIDGLLSGFHDPRASHLAMLTAIAGVDRVQEAYRHAVDGGYLWHEFGDSHLIWASRDFDGRKEMAHYLVTARPKANLDELRARLDDGEIKELRPFGKALDLSLANARWLDNSHAVWEEEDYCTPPLAMEREAVLDDYFSEISVEAVNRGEGWDRIVDLPNLWKAEAGARQGSSE